MSNGIAALASIGGGALIALLAIIGGVQAVTPDANPASASDTVVTYDAR